MDNGPDPSAPWRTRTVRWTDPLEVAAPARSMTGMEFLRRIQSGELPPPPIAELLGMRIVSLDPGQAAFELDPAEFMYNPIGSVHGGILTVLLDSAMGCALHTTLPAGVGYTTLELKVNFVRPVVVGSGTVTARGSIVHAGTNVATTEARLVGADGTLFAHATSTLLLLRPRLPG